MEITGILILAYNNYIDTLNCIESVLKYNTAKVKFLIIDNGSTDHTKVKLLKKGLEHLFGKQILCLTDESIIRHQQLPFVTFLESRVND